MAHPTSDATTPSRWLTSAPSASLAAWSAFYADMTGDPTEGDVYVVHLLDRLQAVFHLSGKTKYFKNPVQLPADSKSSDQLVTERFSLGDGAKTTVSYLFGIQLKQKQDNKVLVYAPNDFER